MKAIVYTTNTGFTKQYADMLGEKTGLPVYPLKEAQNSLEPGAEIIYLGWLMGGTVKGYKKAIKEYAVRALCGVGMSGDPSQEADVRKVNKIAKDMPLFVLQGGFELEKLRGIYKVMMTLMSKGSERMLTEKPNKTAEDMDMLRLMKYGGSRVSAAKLEPVLAWYEANTKE